jgi:hypothetical protein
MKKQLVLLILTIFFLPGVSAGQWYKGGTLHNATGAEWQSASYQNRLATAGDFIAKTAPPSNMDELKSRAEALERCISSAVGAMPNDKVAFIAVICIQDLGYKKIY